MAVKKKSNRIRSTGRKISFSDQTPSIFALNPAFYALAVTFLFFLISLPGLFHHEMWRDEHQAWLVARDAHSIPQLFENMKYEGNPALWHLLLYFITIFTHNPVYMQYLHLFIACGFVYIFNRYSGLDIIHKILFSFGYFTLFEYTIICRSYGLGVLLIFLTAALYKERHSYYILIYLILGLLANISIYGVVFACGLGGIITIDYFIFQKRSKSSLLKLFSGIFILSSGVIFALYQIIPDSNSSFPVSYPNGPFDLLRWAQVASRLFITYFYIPKIAGIHFWNTNIYFDEDVIIYPPFWIWFVQHPQYLWGCIIMPLITFFLSVCVFIRKPLILFLYSGITLILLTVYYYTDLMYLRYCGFLLITLVLSYWLEKYYPDKVYKNKVFKMISFIGIKIKTPLLLMVLTVNILGAIIAYSKDYKEKFSASKEAADFIKKNNLDTMTIVGGIDGIIAPIASYLDTKIYYPQMSDYGSFSIWSKQRQPHLKQLFISVVNLMNSGKERLLLIKNSPAQISFDSGVHNFNMEHVLITKDIKLDLIKIFGPGVVENEQYFIYLIQRINPLKEDVSKYQVLNITQNY
jgi:hypothetical protein